MPKRRSALNLLYSLILIMIISSSPAALAHKLELDFPDTIGDWKLGANPQIFKGDDLFLYIDGGAELYHEYGFAEISVADYARDDDAVTVEAYRMTGNAFGIFSILRGDDDEAVDVGCGGIWSDYYMLFWSDSYLVAITAQTEFDDNRTHLLSIANALAEGLSARETPPALLKLLPEQNRQPGSEKYMVGQVALQNVMPKAAELFSGYEDAASALYAEAGGEKCRLLLLRWMDRETALTAFGAAIARAGEDRTLSAIFQGEFVIVLKGTSCKKRDEYLDEFRRRLAAN